MFTSPQKITVDGVATDLGRINGPVNMASTYRSAHGEIFLDISHTVGPKEESTLVKHRFNKVGVDPVFTDRQRPYSSSVHTVFKAPANGLGFTDDEQIANITAHLQALLEPGVLAKLLGKES